MAWNLNQVRELARPNPAWCTLGCAVCLALIGIQAIHTVEPGFGHAQTRWLAIGLVGLIVASYPAPRQLALAAWPLFLFSLALLVLLISPGVPRSIVPVVNGARCWIDLQVMRAQPSELTKLAFVLAMACYLRDHSGYRRLFGLITPFAIAAVPAVLIVLEPDLGTAILFPPALFALLLAAGARLRHLGGIVALGVLVVGLNIAAVYALPPDQQFLRPHQVDRIKAMVSQISGDRRYVRDIGYQQHKAMTLIGAGGLTGYGPERARTVIDYNNLPEDHNDMIFVVIVNRWGLIGGAGVLLLYAGFIGSLLLIAGKAKDPFGRLVPVGFAGLVFAQVTINVGMSLGLLPITGITLPFVSYGGSSLLASFVMAGLAINLASRRPQPMTRPCFEFDNPDPATPRRPGRF